MRMSPHSWQQLMTDHCSYIHKLSSCEIKTWKKFRPEQDLNLWPCCDHGAVVMGLNPIQVWIFFRVKFHNCLSCVYYCNDQSCLHIFLCSSNKWSFVYSLVTTKSVIDGTWLTNKRTASKRSCFYSFQECIKVLDV